MVSLARAIILLGLGAAAALGVQAALGGQEEARPAGNGDAPGFPVRPPGGPNDPPVVWLDGDLEEITADLVTVRDGEGPRVRIQRLGQGATSFLRVQGRTWRELADPEVDALAPGQPACVESLLDGRTFLALRVFVGVGCGPGA